MVLAVAVMPLAVDFVAGATAAAAIWELVLFRCESLTATSCQVVRVTTW